MSAVFERGLGGKRIMIVGSASGIGAATAKRLALEGAKVICADINIDGAEQVAQAIQAQDGLAEPMLIDIANVNSISHAIEKAEAMWHGLDGAHLNAADLRVIFQDTDAEQLAEDVFERTVDVNLKGHWLCTKALMPTLRQNKGGLVYTSSAAAMAGEPERPAYAMSKSGLNALMRHVASRWGRDGVRANCIAPGFVLTREMEASGQLSADILAKIQQQTRSTRLGTPEDIAACVAFLLSDDATWINGQVLHINGGALML
jgi:NAD(P)-dependent dehydrogenase (short-subunit alcohol dehydrogenase family)